MCVCVGGGGGGGGDTGYTVTDHYHTLPIQ